MEDTQHGGGSEVWQQVLEQLQPKVSRPLFDAWLKQIRPLALLPDRLQLGVPSDFAKSWLERRAGKLIQSTAAQVLARPVHIEFIVSVPQSTSANGPAASMTTSAITSDLDTFGSTPLNDRYVFENFVVGKSNQFAQAAAVSVARNPGTAYNPLFIYGGVGLGKTHLMQAIGHFVLKQRSTPLRVAYVSGDTFTYHVVTSIREDKFSAFRRQYRSVDLWLVDDIQFIAARERTEEEFFQTFNALHETNKQIIISSDRPPRELQILNPRLRSRFEWGLIADIKPPDVETRIAILERMAQRENVKVDPEVIRYIAQTVVNNIRVLEGALRKVIFAASLTKQPTTLDFAMEQLRDHSLGFAQRPISIRRIQETVSSHFHISLEDLVSPRRTRDLVNARQIAMYLAREHVKASFPEIAKKFGGRDHSTVIHACTKIRQAIEDNSELRLTVEELGRQVQTYA